MLKKIIEGTGLVFILWTGVGDLLMLAASSYDLKAANHYLAAGPRSNFVHGGREYPDFQLVAEYLRRAHQYGEIAKLFDRISSFTPAPYIKPTINNLLGLENRIQNQEVEVVPI